jgi:hypothetical protein
VPDADWHASPENEAQREMVLGWAQGSVSVPHDGGRPRADGLGLRPDRPVPPRLGVDVARRARAAQTAPGSGRGPCDAPVGRADRRVGDRLPFVGLLPGGRVRYAAGFSGNGVGPTWLAAQILASLATGLDDEWTRLPLVQRTPRRRLPPEPLKSLGGRAVRAAILRVEEAEEEHRPPPALARAVASVPRKLGLPLGTR